MKLFLLPLLLVAVLLVQATGICASVLTFEKRLDDDRYVKLQEAIRRSHQPHESMDSGVGSKKLKRDNFPFRDMSLSHKERVEDLIGRLTIDELLDQITKGGARRNGPAPAIDRLGIQPYQWDTECLHGYMNQATIFPQALGLAATFSKSLIHKMANVISIEARAKHTSFMKKKNFGDQTGLSCFAPVINIMRHPLWGRNQETYGEDPVLTGEMAHSYVTGLQGDGLIKPATATCKHFGVHGGPEDKPVSRFSFNANVSTHDLGTTFLPAFRKCVNAGAHAIMCSYNAINGVPACANKFMMGDILRGKFGFKGYVVSDENAIENVDDQFKYTKTYNETALACKRAGCDLELTAYPPEKCRFSYLGPLVKDGKIAKEEIAESAKRLFFTRMSLGEFDAVNPWNNISLDVVQSREHLALAEEITAKSFVLLKNDGVLPLLERFKTAAIVGPFADNGPALVGDYAYMYDGLKFSYPSDALANISAGSKTVEQACVGNVDSNLPHCTSYNQTAVVKAVSNADVVLLAMGTGPGVEAESNDRSDMSLPGKQMDIIADVVKNAPEHARIILLLFNAGPLDISHMLKHRRINAIIECYFPGQSAGGAISKVLTGAVNPAARLPNTWYKNMAQVPPMTNYSMHGRTYKYMRAEPLLPFGYGLSYTLFEYHKAVISPRVYYGCETIMVDVELENVGAMGGDEVIQVYLKPLHSAVDKDLLHKLVSFERVSLNRGERKIFHLQIPHDALAVWKEGAQGWNYYLEPGMYYLFIGGQQPGQAHRVPSQVLETIFKYIGDELLLDECEK